MNLFLSMLPLYLIGNLHCLGMCGPLVAMIGRHRWRWFYFSGRLMSFALAGLVAGTAGALVQGMFIKVHLPEMLCFLFGGGILIGGVFYLLGRELPGGQWLADRTAPVTQRLSLLLLQDHPTATFLFGFATIFLPCGQTVIVYSAVALYGDPWVGLMNGFLFALLTSPSLFFAMQAMRMLNPARKYYRPLIGCAAIFAGLMAILRGLAQMEVVDHLVLNPSVDSAWHLVLF